jgi:hypothetical protein
MKDEKTETHESFGMIGVSRYTCTPAQTFFGSSIKHHAGIAIEIHEAEKIRSLSGDHFHEARPLIRVSMTPAQFADMITSANIGGGVPCTLERVMGKARPDCPETNERATIVSEFKEAMEDLAQRLDELVAKAEALKAKPTILKGDRAEFVSLAETIRRRVSEAMPFINSQFNEAMDGILTEAKADLDSWVSQMLRVMGTEALQDKLRQNAPQLPPPPPDVRPPTQ